MIVSLLIIVQKAITVPTPSPSERTTRISRLLTLYPRYSPLFFLTFLRPTTLLSGSPVERSQTSFLPLFIQSKLVPNAFPRSVSFLSSSILLTEILVPSRISSLTLGPILGIPQLLLKAVRVVVPPPTCSTRTSLPPNLNSSFLPSRPSHDKI